VRAEVLYDPGRPERLESVEQATGRHVLRWRARQPHFRVHGPGVGPGGKGYPKVTLVPPIELVEAREGSAEGAGKVGRVIQRDEDVGRRRRFGEQRAKRWYVGTGRSIYQLVICQSDEEGLCVLVIMVVLAEEESALLTQ
jgi:hypothetical protein